MFIKQKPRLLKDRAKVSSILLIWKSANLIIKSVQYLLFKKNNHQNNILIFRTGSIGDSICAMPAISNIRGNFPNSHICLLTNAGKGYQNLVSIEAFIKPGVVDEIINYENLTRQELIRKVKAKKFDLIIHLTQYNVQLWRIMRDMFFFRFVTEIPSGFGWHYDNIIPFKKAQEKYIRQYDERTRLNTIISENGISIQSENQFHFNIASDDVEKVNSLKSSLQMKDLPAIGVVVGAKRPQNRWPIEYFEFVIRHFASKYNILIIGGPEDEFLIRHLSDIPNVYSFCGQLTPVQSGLLFQKCQLVLSNDTGPMHLAYSFHVPVIALFSNRDYPNRWFPPEDNKNVTIRANAVPCSVCFTETCSNNICMKKITPLEVIEIIQNKLLKSNLL